MTGARSGRGGERSLKVRVKSGGARSLSSRLWLERQLNDPYVLRAKREGYRSRAAYKLIEIDDRFRFLKPGGVVVDLGAAPGGWSQVAANRVAAGQGRGRVVAIDVVDMAGIPGLEFLRVDFLDADTPDRVQAMLDGPADVVLSDMAANATGHKRTDHLRTMGLVEASAEFAREVLEPGGAFLAKVLQGGTEHQLLARLKRDFATVRHVKPAASRADSAELYLLATGFHGRPSSDCSSSPSKANPRTTASRPKRPRSRSMACSAASMRPVRGSMRSARSACPAETSAETPIPSRR
jgi:23S rRNA (uridine2552-2'-O)-methyltransferase